jgi:general secretion pathway protein G
MNIYLNQKRNRRGFTLIEMIGVLAVIAILASLLIPKIYEAINNSRINNAIVSYNTVKTAVADHFAKYGALNSQAGTNFAIAADVRSTNYDIGVLLLEGFIDKPFVTKVGTSSEVKLLAGPTAATVGDTDGAFWLSGQGSENDETINASFVLVAVIHGVTASDAHDISQRLDGDSLSTLPVGSVDHMGRVKFAAIGAGATGDVTIYITHR